MKKNRLSLLIASFFFILSTNRTFAQNSDIKIGATLALSGKLAFTGVSQQQGLELAVEDVNKSGGINGRLLKLVLEDNTGDPKAALSGVNKLIQSDSVDLIFSSFSHITQVIKDKVKSSSKIMFYAASIGEVAKESPLFFRDWGDAESLGTLLAREISKAGYKNIVFLTETSEGCLSFQNAFIKAAEAFNLSIISEESYSPGETDFKPLLMRIAKKRPDAITTCTWRDSAILMPQLKSLGLIKIPTFQILAPLLPSSDTPEIRKLYEENQTRATWHGFIEGSLTNEQKNFFERSQSRFKSPLRFEGMLAYDDIMVIAAALRACSGSPMDNDCIVKTILKTKHNGIAGLLQFDEFGRSNRADLLIKVKDGKWQSAL